MTDWKAFSHAYGEASQIPDLLDRLRNAPDEAIGQDLWSCLCHQGTVYSASYVALQPLFEIASALPPSDRLSPLMLIGHIIASDDLYGLEHRPADLILPLIPGLETLVEEAMAVENLQPDSFIYHLEAAITFAGDLFWGRNLNHLVDGEFPGQCPACRHDLYLVIGDLGFFITAQDWVGAKNKGAAKNAILPTAEQDLAGSGAWLHSKALTYRQPAVAFRIRHLFGTGTCPACQQKFSLADAIALGLPSRQMDRD